jgi:hypothetical protein
VTPDVQDFLPPGTMIFWVQDPLPGIDEQLTGPEEECTPGGYLEFLQEQRLRTWKELARLNEEIVTWGGL